MRDIVGAVKFQSGMMISFSKKLAQSKPFGLRRRCEECIPAGCRTVLLRNRMYNSNGQSERMRTSANRGAAACRKLGVVEGGVETVFGH